MIPYPFQENSAAQGWSFPHECHLNAVCLHLGLAVWDFFRVVDGFVGFFFTYFLCSEAHNLKAFDSVSPFTPLVVSVMEKFLMVSFLMQRRANYCIVLGCVAKGANLCQFFKTHLCVELQKKTPG